MKEALRSNKIRYIGAGPPCQGWLPDGRVGGVNVREWRFDVSRWCVFFTNRISGKSFAVLGEIFDIFKVVFLCIFWQLSRYWILRGKASWIIQTNLSYPLTILFLSFIYTILFSERLYARGKAVEKVRRLGNNPRSYISTVRRKLWIDERMDRHKYEQINRWTEEQIICEKYFIRF